MGRHSFSLRVVYRIWSMTLTRNLYGIYSIMHICSSIFFIFKHLTPSHKHHHVHTPRFHPGTHFLHKWHLCGLVAEALGCFGLHMGDMYWFVTGMNARFGFASVLWASMIPFIFIYPWFCGSMVTLFSK